MKNENRESVEIVLLLSSITLTFLMYFLNKFLLQLEKNKALYHAVRENNFSNVQEMISKGAQINPYLYNFYFHPQFSPLHLSCINSNYRISNYLLSHGANIESKCLYGETPLDFAVEANNVHLVSLLIFHGAIVNHRSGQAFQSPLMRAAQFGSDKVI